MLDSLQLACKVCESGAALERFRHIVFSDGQVRAFNGLVSLQAPFDAGGEEFAVNEDRLARALDACAGDELKITFNDKLLVFKQNKLTIRVRKLDATPVYNPRLTLPGKDARMDAKGVQEALRTVAPFISADASRPWSVSVLVKDGHAWATNNLSLVRSPVPDKSMALRIPSAAALLLLELPALDWIARDGNLIYVGCKRTALSFPEAAGEWPDTAKFFAGQPKQLPKLDDELQKAAKTVEKFADRFVTLNASSVETKTNTLESEYEVQVKKGTGTYSARLLSLILSHATHADFSSFPKPIFFAGEGLEGTAVGVSPEKATP